MVVSHLAVHGAGERNLPTIPGLAEPFRDSIPEAYLAGLIPDRLPFLRCPSDPDLPDKGSAITSAVRVRSAGTPRSAGPHTISINITATALGEHAHHAESTDVRGLCGQCQPGNDHRRRPGAGHVRDLRAEDCTEHGEDGLSNTILLGETLPSQLQSRDGPGSARRTRPGPHDHRSPNHFTDYTDPDGCTVSLTRYS